MTEDIEVRLHAEVKRALEIYAGKRGVTASALARAYIQEGLMADALRIAQSQHPIPPGYELVSTYSDCFSCTATYKTSHGLYVTYCAHEGEFTGITFGEPFTNHLWFGIDPPRPFRSGHVMLIVDEVRGGMGDARVSVVGTNGRIGGRYEVVVHADGSADEVYALMPDGMRIEDLEEECCRDMGSQS